MSAGNTATLSAGQDLNLQRVLSAMRHLSSSAEFHKTVSQTSSPLQKWLADNSKGMCHLLIDPTLRPLENDELLGQMLALARYSTGGCLTLRAI